MKAIILAAGLGKRLLPLTEDKPKCLIEFSGKTLLDRLLKTFKSGGINDIVLVIGHKSEKIKNVDLNLVKNEKYSKTGIMHSLFCAKEKLEKTVIVSYGDIIFENSVLEKLLESKYDITAVVDKKWEKYWKLILIDFISFKTYTHSQFSPSDHTYPPKSLFLNFKATFPLYSI